MGKRLSNKNRKRRRDQARTYGEGNHPARHKVAATRSKKALKKKAFPMT